MEHQNGGSSTLRIWDLNGNSTRYDRMEAAPSDAYLRLMWSILSGTLFFVALLTIVLVLGFITAPAKVRKNTFNTYLFFLVIPDFFFSVFCFITCTLNAARGRYFSGLMCQLQHFYLAFGIGANAWLNAIVALQLYRLLRKSRFPDLKKQYKTPTYKDAAKQSLAIYLYVAILACLFYIPTEEDTMAIASHKGIFCLAGEIHQGSTLFFWIGFLPLLVFIPLLIVIWTYYQVRHHQMLPKTGRRRVLAMFFTRLILIFVVMWVPGLTLIFLGGVSSSPWLTWFGVTWAHLQSAAAGIAALLKPDINNAVMDLLLCRKSQIPAPAYRVAVQSVSAVLEGDSDHGEKSSSKENVVTDKAGQVDLEQPVPKDSSTSVQTVNTTTEELIAYWPSQRPMRKNPRLARYEQEIVLQEQRQKLVNAKPTLFNAPGRQDTRSVAKNLLNKLQNDDEIQVQKSHDVSRNTTSGCKA